MRWATATIADIDTDPRQSQAARRQGDNQKTRKEQSNQTFHNFYLRFCHDGLGRPPLLQCRKPGSSPVGQLAAHDGL
jgi:hypothetical protein